MYGCNDRTASSEHQTESCYEREYGRGYVDCRYAVAAHAFPQECPVRDVKHYYADHSGQSWEQHLAEKRTDGLAGEIYRVSLHICRLRS